MRIFFLFLAVILAIPSFVVGFIYAVVKDAFSKGNDTGEDFKKWITK